MKYQLSELKHMKEWVLANFTALVFFIIYSVFGTDYNLSHLAPSFSLIVGGLALYHLCGLLWMAALFERLDSKMVYISAGIAILCMHFGVWSLQVDFFTNLVSLVIGYTPQFHLLNVQAAAMYVYLIGWGVVCYKATKHNLPDLQMLAVSGGIIAAIILGYHLLGFWSIFAPINDLITKVDEAVLPTLMNLDKETLMASCNLIDGVDCFRFPIADGYPDALLNYNSNYVDSIRFFANDPMTQNDSFYHSVLYRDALFVASDAQHYSRSFFYDQSNGIVNYNISNYLADLPVNLLSFIGWMSIGAVVFWQWIVLGVGIEHSVRLTPRDRKTPSKKAWGLMVLAILPISTALAFAELDQLFGYNLPLLLAVVVGLVAFIIWLKLKKTVLFLATSFILSLPACVIYVSGMIDQYGTYNPEAIRDFSQDALIATVVIAMLFVCGVSHYFKRKTIVAPEAGWMVIIFVVTASLYTFVGSHFIFLDMIADSEELRMAGLEVNSQLIQFCKAYPFDACLTVNDPDWKQAYFKPLMDSVWYIVTSGIIVFSAAFYSLVRLSHKK